MKTLIYIKITNNNINCNSNRLLKVQLLLQELFILAVNIHVYMYGKCIHIHTENIHVRFGESP